MKTKVYINIPAKAVAGGVESLFQLADAINNSGGESIVLWDFVSSNPIPEKYRNYNIQHSKEVEDRNDNWIIYPEVWTEKIHTFQNLKKAIWWLSVDNNHGKFNEFDNSSITHFYQSYYALDFLLKKGVEKYLPLFDYVSEKYTNSVFEISQKRDIVCYNPVKGREITSQIISQNPNIKFVPIVGLNEEQIIELLKTSKIYIDFGHHPGRDRIPRESAILGNCVITNLSGSAEFYNDVPVSKKYKITDINKVGELINHFFENFDLTIEEYSLYRLMVKNQKEQLYNQVKQYFI
jgi:hypothetical protein